MNFINEFLKILVEEIKFLYLYLYFPKLVRTSVATRMIQFLEEFPNKLESFSIFSFEFSNMESRMSDSPEPRKLLLYNIESWFYAYEETQV